MHEHDLVCMMLGAVVALACGWSFAQVATATGRWSKLYLTLLLIALVASAALYARS